MHLPHRQSLAFSHGTARCWGQQVGWERLWCRMDNNIALPHQAVAGNQAVAVPLSAVEQAVMIDAAAQKFAELFDILHIDHRTDHNTRDTPRRAAKMYVEELLAGRFTSPPHITDFDNVAEFDGLIVTGPIDVRSTCAHHLMPIYGSAVIGIVPAADGRIIGLSKYDRIVQHFSSRFQIQEELVKQIGQYLLDATAPRGLAIRISAVHMCKTHRGVLASHRAKMVSTVYYGALKTDAALKAEFLQECQTLEHGAGS